MTILRKSETWQRPRKRRTFELDADEQRNVKLALRVMRAEFGGWDRLAKQIGCTPDTLQKAAGNGMSRNAAPSAGLALRVSQAAGVPVEDLLSGAWFRSSTCPVCGRTG